MTGGDTVGNAGGRPSAHDGLYKAKLVGFLGEHQSQYFYDRLWVYSSEDETMFDLPTGQPLPIDLSEMSSDNNLENSARPSPVLAVFIHFFTRKSSNTSLSVNNNSSRATSSYRRSATVEVKPGDTPVSEQMPVEDSRSGKEKTVDWATAELGEIQQTPFASFVAYFPVSHMSTANDVCVTSYAQKRVHLVPHQHEFVAFPLVLTLPIDQLAERVVSGMKKAETLINKSVPIPLALTEAIEHLAGKGFSDSTDSAFSSSPKTTHTDRAEVLKEDEVVADSSNRIPRFVITSRSVYNRICTLRQLEREGICLSKSRHFNQPPFSCRQDEEPVPSASNDLKITPLSASKFLFHEKLIDWVGLRIASTGCHDSSRFDGPTPIDLSNIQLPIGKSSQLEKPRDIRVVCVRRESLDCGNTIDSVLRTSRFPPARLRRTRVRGTTHQGIKLKHPTQPDLFLFSQNFRPRLSHTKRSYEMAHMDTSNGSAGDGQFRPKRPQWGSRDSLHVITSLNGFKDTVLPVSCSHPRLLPSTWRSNCGALSPTTLYHSSIATRVKCGGHSRCSTTHPSKTSQHDGQTPEHGGSDRPAGGNGEVASELVLKCRNRVRPKRLDPSDQDLEIALERSLRDCSTAANVGHNTGSVVDLRVLENGPTAGGKQPECSAKPANQQQQNNEQPKREVQDVPTVPNSCGDTPVNSERNDLKGTASQQGSVSQPGNKSSFLNTRQTKRETTRAGGQRRNNNNNRRGSEQRPQSQTSVEGDAKAVKQRNQNGYWFTLASTLQNSQAMQQIRPQQPTLQVPVKISAKRPIDLTQNTESLINPPQSTSNQQMLDSLVKAEIDKLASVLTGINDTCVYANSVLGQALWSQVPEQIQGTPGVVHPSHYVTSVSQPMQTASMLTNSLPFCAAVPPRTMWTQLKYPLLAPDGPANRVEPSATSAFTSLQSSHQSTPQQPSLPPSYCSDGGSRLTDGEDSLQYQLVSDSLGSNGASPDGLHPAPMASMSPEAQANYVNSLIQLLPNLVYAMPSGPQAAQLLLATESNATSLANLQQPQQQQQQAIQIPCLPDGMPVWMGQQQQQQQPVPIPLTNFPQTIPLTGHQLIDTNQLSLPGLVSFPGGQQQRAIAMTTYQQQPYPQQIINNTTTTSTTTTTNNSNSYARIVYSSPANRQTADHRPQLMWAGPHNSQMFIQSPAMLTGMPSQNLPFVTANTTFMAPGVAVGYGGGVADRLQGTPALGVQQQQQQHQQQHQQRMNSIHPRNQIGLVCTPTPAPVSLVCAAAVNTTSCDRKQQNLSQHHLPLPGLPNQPFPLQFIT